MRFDSRSSCVEIRFSTYAEKFSISIELNLAMDPSLTHHWGTSKMGGFRFRVEVRGSKPAPNRSVAQRNCEV